jgi:hypothetical protein
LASPSRSSKTTSLNWVEQTVTCATSTTARPPAQRVGIGISAINTVFRRLSTL